MRIILRASIYICLATVIILSLSLFDIISLNDTITRICGVICCVSLFCLVYSRVWLISYRRKPRKPTKS